MGYIVFNSLLRDVGITWSKPTWFVQSVKGVRELLFGERKFKIAKSVNYQATDRVVKDACAILPYKGKDNNAYDDQNSA